MPAPAFGVTLDDVIVQIGCAPPLLCQLTSTFAVLPAPVAFVPTTEYVARPAALAVAMHVLPRLVQPVHAKLVGVFVQVAVSVIDAPSSGLLIELASEHDGVPGGAIDVSLTGMQKITGCDGLPLPSATYPFATMAV